MGSANAEAEDYESKRQKDSYSVLQCAGQKFIAMHGYELLNHEGYVGCTVPVL